MILWLASYPRSGNTLARMIIHAGSGLPTYSIYGEGKRNLGEGPVAKLIGYKPRPDSVGVLADCKELFIIKTHAGPESAEEHPAIYIVRDGRDALVSHAHLLKRDMEGKRYRDTLASLIRGRQGTRRWSVMVLGWKAREAPTAYVRYEDMLKTPYKSIQAALNHLGIPFELETNPLESFEALHEMNPRFFRRGEAGSWNQEMPPGLHKLFWRIHEGGMVAYGYTKG